MKQYDLSTVFNYIKGNDLGEYNIDELENNPLFMIDVIRCTKDKKMYNMCSNSVKTDFNFVKYMIETFSDDYKLINEITDIFFSKNDIKDIENYELQIILSKHAKNDICYEKYAVKSLVFYTKTMININFAKNEDEEDYGLGFVFINYLYNSSEVICDFFAEKMIKDLFYGKDNKYSDLEKEMHTTNNSFDDIEKKGINNYLINYIESNDNYLSSYICNHLYLLNEVKSDLLYIKKNWSNYEEIVNKRKLLILFQELEKEFDNMIFPLNYTIDEIVYYTAFKLGLNKEILKYYYLFVDSNTLNIDDSSFNFAEKLLYEKVKSLLIELFLNNDYCNDISLVRNKKIIDFNDEKNKH